MAYDEGQAQLLRDTFAEMLEDMEGLSEKKMFGGLCFLLHGNMVAGVHEKGGMARVGKSAEPEALEMEGVTPLSFTGRKMGGMVDVADAVLSDDRRRSEILQLALSYAQSLPPK